MLIVAAGGATTPAVVSVAPVTVIVAPVVSSVMASFGAEPVTVINPPARDPLGGVTMVSSFGAVPVTVTAAAAGIWTEFDINVGALPVTAIVAEAGIRTKPEVSVGALPVTVTVADAGIKTELEVSVGALPVTAMVAAAGVKVMATRDGGAKTFARRAHQPGWSSGLSVHAVKSDWAANALRSALSISR
jgi:hypothetical protein